MSSLLEEVTLDRVQRGWNKKKDSSLKCIKSGGHVFSVRESTVNGLENRLCDKARVENTLGLEEFGSQEVLIYLMNGGNILGKNSCDLRDITLRPNANSVHLDAKFESSKNKKVQSRVQSRVLETDKKVEKCGKFNRTKSI